MSTKENLGNHIESAHSINMPKAKCEICDLEFRPNALQKHKERIHNPRNETIECETCHKIMSKDYYLKEHRMMHSTKKFDCTKCEKSFETQRMVYCHRRAVHEKVLIECEECGKLVNKLSIKDHRESHEIEKMKKVKCTGCNQDFNPKYLNKHIKQVHLKNKDI